MRLLITRPEPAAGRFAERVRALGAEPIVAPLLEIEPVRMDAPSLDHVQALIITSGNGVRAYAALTPDRRLPVYAVGDATAHAARAEGFRNILSAAGNAADLIELVRSSLSPGDGALLHLSGEDVAGDIAGQLAESGFVIERVPIYRAVAAPELPDAAVRALRTRTIDAAAFFSPRTAATFVNLISRARLNGAVAHATAFCLSAAVAEPLRESEARAPWAQIAVADHPTEDHMVSLIFQAISQA